MRITKLHILIFFALIVSGFCALRRWNEKNGRIRGLEQQVALQQKALEEWQARAAREEVPVPAAEVSAGTAAAVAASQEPSPPLEPLVVEVAYEVQKGDSLWSIAKRKDHFGLGHRWYDIWKANEEQIADFDRIEPGQTLVIPLDKPESHPWPVTAEAKKKTLLNSGEPDPVPVENFN